MSPVTKMKTDVIRSRGTAGNHRRCLTSRCRTLSLLTASQTQNYQPDTVAIQHVLVTKGFPLKLVKGSMKMRRTLAIAALVAAICCALSAQTTKSDNAAKKQTAGDQTVQDRLKQLEKQRSEALIKGDAGFLDRTTADDYSMITSSGQLRNKGRMMGDLKSGEVKFQSADVDDLEVRIYGDTAVVTGRHTQKAQSAGKDISGQYRFTRVYVKQKGQWKAVAYQATSIAKP